MIIFNQVSSTITCPLEVVKTRLQSSIYHKRIHHTSIIRSLYGHVTGVFGFLGFEHLISDIRRQEGIRALWKGIGPTLIGVVPARYLPLISAVYFSVYSQGKHLYTSLNGNKESWLVHMLSAASAGTIVATFTSPIWLIKTRMVAILNLATSI